MCHKDDDKCITYICTFHIRYETRRVKFLTHTYLHICDFIQGLTLVSSFVYATWETAKQDCISQGLQLLTIDSAEKQARIEAALQAMGTAAHHHNTSL